MEAQNLGLAPLYVRSGSRSYKVASADDVLEVARAVIGQRMQRGAAFSDPQTAKAFFRDKLGGLEREVFAAAFLDTRHRPIEYMEFSMEPSTARRSIRGRWFVTRSAAMPQR